MFSKMKHVKILLQASLSEKKLESILWINEEGPDFLEYDPMSAIGLLASEKNRQPNQKKRKSYKPRERKKRKFSSLSDSNNESEEDNNEETDITLFWWWWWWIDLFMS